jgi:tetratricopeptide (TPR) repeat protein
MSSENKGTHEGLEQVEVALTNAEHFVEKNQKILLYALGAVVLLVALFFGTRKFYFQPRESEAQSQMFTAERYFEKDSFNLALNGDGNYQGFLGIIDEYGMTDAANLAHYYAGISYLHLGKYDEAIAQLKKFDGDDMMVGPVAVGAIGDAYLEQGKHDEATSQYLKAADKGENNFIAPVYLMKAAQVFEADKNYKKALELYEQIQKDYPLSTEGRQIEKYITRATLLSEGK